MSILSVFFIVYVVVY